MTSLITIFFFILSEFGVEEICNGWLKPGITEKKDGQQPSEIVFPSIFPFCLMISLAVFTVTCDVSIGDNKFTIRKTHFRFRRNET